MSGSSNHAYMRVIDLTPPFSYVKEKIALAPNNASAWNYLRGALDHTSTSYATLSSFVHPYTLPRSQQPPTPDVEDLDNPLPSKMAHLPCAAAIEFEADMYEAEGEENLQRAVEVCMIAARCHNCCLTALHDSYGTR